MERLSRKSVMESVCTCAGGCGEVGKSVSYDVKEKRVRLTEGPRRRPSQAPTPVWCFSCHTLCTTLKQEEKREIDAEQTHKK